VPLGKPNINIFLQEKTMLQQLTQILRNYKEDQELEVLETSTFEELGLDSLDTVQLLMDIEDEIGVSVEVNASITNIAALIKAIEAAKA